MSGNYGITMQIFSVLGTYIFLFIFSVATWVMLGVAAYNDAKGRCNKEPVMWGLLVGFLTWIPGIIYLCVRNSSKPQVLTCPGCGLSYWSDQPGCPRCGVPNQLEVMRANPYLETYRRRARVTMIIGIVLGVIAVILTIVAVAQTIGVMFSVGNGYGGGFGYHY